MFLVGIHIPQYILDLPSEAMSSPLGPMIRPMIDNMQAQIQQASLGHQAFGDRNPHATESSQSRGLTEGPSVKLLSLAKYPALFEKGNRSAIEAKLREFDPAFESVSAGDTHALWQSVDRLDADHVFPTLDLLRLRALEDEETCVGISGKARVILERFCTDADSPRPAIMMSLRLLANVFAFSKAASVLLQVSDSQQVQLCEAALLGIEHEHTSVREAASAFALNIANHSERLSEDAAIRLLCGLENQFSSLAGSSELSLHRILSAFGLLLTRDEDLRTIGRTLGANLEPFLRESSSPEVQLCAREIVKELDRA